MIRVLPCLFAIATGMPATGVMQTPVRPAVPPSVGVASQTFLSRDVLAESPISRGDATSSPISRFRSQHLVVPAQSSADQANFIGTRSISQFTSHLSSMNSATRFKTEQFSSAEVHPGIVATLAHPWAILCGPLLLTAVFAVLAGAYWWRRRLHVLGSKLQMTEMREFSMDTQMAFRPPVISLEAPLAKWDPVRFCDGVIEPKLMNLRRLEIKHVTLCLCYMQLFSSGVANASRECSGDWIRLSYLVAALCDFGLGNIESWKEGRTCDEGDAFSCLRGLVTDFRQQKHAVETEIANQGRLAVLAIAGMFVQQGVCGTSVAKKELTPVLRGFVKRRHCSARAAATASVVRRAAAVKRSVAKETLKRLRRRSPKGGKGTERKKMPPTPDPWTLDEDGRRIFPWPKSFAEIVQTASYSSMELFMKGETRLEVCFPPLPLADLDWNTCDPGETRVTDSNVLHAIAYSKLILKDPRALPKLDVEEAAEAASAGAPMQEPDQIKELLDQRFAPKKRDPKKARRSVRVVFPNKTDMLRSRDIHFEKWRKMERPELLRRGFYTEVNEDNWPGPFEDVFIYVVAQEAGDLLKVRNYVEKADSVAKKQGRVLRHVLFNLNCNKLRADIDYYNRVLPMRTGLANTKVHYEFLSTFRNAYFIRFGKYTLTVLRDPFNIDYSGALYHAHPSPWQFFMTDRDGSYRTIDVSDKRPSFICFKRKMQRAFDLAQDAGLTTVGFYEDTFDDVYDKPDLVPGTLGKPVEQATREGLGEEQWWEGAFDEELSDKWRWS